MLFNSLAYLIFLPVVVALYYLCPAKFRWVMLLVASCYFYMYFIPKYILILFLLILIDYFAAILINRFEGKKRKLMLIVSLAANIGLLGFFKYLYFIDGIVKTIIAFTGHSAGYTLPEIILPIGLSFHTFQSMAYTIEVYKGRQQPETHLGIYSVYVLFFPQMVAGPIERFDRLGVQLKEEHKFRWDHIRRGLQLVIFGLFIKMAVADNIAPFVNEAYSHAGELASVDAWLAVFLFSFQIYADFFGYSTIAAGSAMMMGITLADNFRAPYLSKNISEFWTRWHISLSTWFRDYLYIPLGGNKVPGARWAFNILVVFAVSGLWHGANLTFIVWGLIHAALYLLERLFKTDKTSPRFFAKLSGMLLTFLVVTLAWVFFRSESFSKAGMILSNLFHDHHAPFALKLKPYLWYTLALLILSDILLRGQRFDRWLSQRGMAVRWAAYLLIGFCLLCFSGGEEQPFIYFQF